MAGFNPYPNMTKPAQSGVYAGSGIAQGGQVGRSATMHMGLPSASSGGVNPYGSPRAALAPQPIAYGHGVLPRPAAPVRLVVPRPTLPGHVPPRVAPAVSGVAHRPVLGTTTVVVPPPPINTHDAQYQSQAAAANYAYDLAGQPITTLRGQMQTFQPQYNLGLYDINHANELNTERQNASLAARGLLNSGGEVNAEVARKAAYDKQFTALENQYGTAAANRIMGQIDALEANRTGARDLAMQNAERAALDRALAYMQAHPPTAPVKSTTKRVPVTPVVSHGGTVPLHAPVVKRTRAVR